MEDDLKIMEDDLKVTENALKVTENKLKVTEIDLKIMEDDLRITMSWMKCCDKSQCCSHGQILFLFIYQFRVCYQFYFAMCSWTLYTTKLPVVDFVDNVQYQNRVWWVGKTKCRASPTPSDLLGLKACRVWYSLSSER